jgi:hypothetical protein
MSVHKQAKMYAQACRAWYGDKARDVVLGKLEEQRRAGDQLSLRFWELAANELASQDGRKSVRFS